jgi:hypothetical protein
VQRAHAGVNLEQFVCELMGHGNKRTLMQQNGESLSFGQASKFRSSL